MSDNRKFLVAKRKNERGKCTNLTQQNRNNNDKRTTKRQAPSCDPTKKNIANERLKRLRTSLNDEVRKTNTPPRKRPQIDSPQLPVMLKVAKRPNQEPIPVRNTGSIKDVEEMEWSTEDSLIPNVSTSVTSPSKNHLFIVVDTNIFLSHLLIIKNIVTVNITGDIKPVIFIPWIVIEELDFIKDDSNRTDIKFKAREAIKYIERMLASKHERMIGQTLDEVNAQRSTGKSQDNKIIACCLQVLEKHSNMILLTSDINLKNKAHFNSIPVCSHSEIMGKILQNQTKAQLIMNKMTSLCATVIHECAKNAYGLAYNKMQICQSPLKTLHDCIDIFNKYWFPVFQEVLMKQFKKSIDDLSLFLVNNKSITEGSNELNDLLRLCVRVCLFLKDIECCKDVIENTIHDLNNIKES